MPKLEIEKIENLEEFLKSLQKLHTEEENDKSETKKVLSKEELIIKEKELIDYNTLNIQEIISNTLTQSGDLNNSTSQTLLNLMQLYKELKEIRC